MNVAKGGSGSEEPSLPQEGGERPHGEGNGAVASRPRQEDDASSAAAHDPRAKDEALLPQVAGGKGRVEVLEEPWVVEGDGEAPEEEVETEAPSAEGLDSCVVDLAEDFSRIFNVNSFGSFQEFEKLFNKFKEETGSVFRVKSSCSVAYENSRRKKHFIPARFKFVSIKYCCVHYGQPKVTGQGIRTKQRCVRRQNGRCRKRRHWGLLPVL